MERMLCTCVKELGQKGVQQATITPSQINSQTAILGPGVQPCPRSFPVAPIGPVDYTCDPTCNPRLERSDRAHGGRWRRWRVRGGPLREYFRVASQPVVPLPDGRQKVVQLSVLGLGLGLGLVQSGLGRFVSLKMQKCRIDCCRVVRISCLAEARVVRIRCGPQGVVFPLLALVSLLQQRRS